MNFFKTIEVHGRTHVLRDNNRNGIYINGYGQKIKIPNPDYRRTGRCLCGILKPGQTLMQFAEKYYKQKDRRERA